jgi:hypothetical protein
MESRNVILAVLIVAIALGVFYMIDPTFGGLLKEKKEGFENNNNNSNNMNIQPALAPNGSFNANNYSTGANDTEEIMNNPNVANMEGNNMSEMTPAPNNNVAEGFENLTPSPMPFASAEKPANCYPKNQLAPSELLPNDPNSKWAQVNPMGAGDISGKNFLNAGALIGVNTVGSSLRNASWDLRSEPPNPQVQVSPWMQSSIEPDVLRRPLEIG